MAPRPNLERGARQPTKMRFLVTLFTWIFIGPVGMLLTLVSIVQRGTGWTTGHDALFFAFLLAALGARWIDYVNGDPVTSGSDGATLGAARRYMIGVTSLGLAA